MPTIHEGWEKPSLCGKVGVDNTSSFVCDEGVDDAEFGDGPVVLEVAAAGSEDDISHFLFCPVWIFEALNEQTKPNQ